MGHWDLIHPDSRLLTAAEPRVWDSPSRAQHSFPEGTPPHHLGCTTGSDRGHQFQVSESCTSWALPTLGGFLICLLLFAACWHGKTPSETQFLVDSPLCLSETNTAYQVPNYSHIGHPGQLSQMYYFKSRTLGNLKDGYMTKHPPAKEKQQAGELDVL